jgi:hypothetical protein
MFLSTAGRAEPYLHHTGGFFTPMALDIVIAERGGQSVLVW